jgi:hypothetical protein
VLCALLAAWIAGCGGGASTSISSAEPSGQFEDPVGVHGKEPVATFGRESGGSERSEASAVLSESLTARQEADFATQCATLGKRGMKSVFGIGKSIGSQAECKTELEKLAKPLSKTESIRADTLGGEIAALRIKGNQAFALYHGSDSKDHAMPMEEEGGTWKVGSILTLELPKPEASSKAEKKKEG